MIDDLLATGGTMAAACKLVEKIGGQIAGIVFLGFELRQNYELMAAEARATRLSIQAAIWNSLADVDRSELDNESEKD